LQSNLQNYIITVQHNCFEKLNESERPPSNQCPVVFF